MGSSYLKDRKKPVKEQWEDYIPAEETVQSPEEVCRLVC